MTTRTRNVIAVALIAIFAVVLLLTRGCGDENPPSVYRFRSGNLVYQYHTPTNAETLFDVSADPKMLHDLGRDRAADLVRLREAFLAKNSIHYLAELRRPDRELIDRLRDNGYFGE